MTYVFSVEEILSCVIPTMFFCWGLAFLAGHYRRKCKKLEKEILSLQNTISILKLKVKDNF